MCNCENLKTLVDISNDYSAFKNKLEQLEVGAWVLLMQCLDCGQFWKVDEWDKYQSIYAVKVSNRHGWEEFDSEALIKERMIENRGGLTESECMQAGCGLKQVKGSAFCVEHLYKVGARA